MKNIAFILLLALSACSTHPAPKSTTIDKPKVSFTFDDGVTTDILDYQFEDWNEMILKSLDQAGVKAIFFVTGSNKIDAKGMYLLNSWDKRGHRIGNHSFSHPSFSSDKQSAQTFENELLRTDSIISKYPHFIPLFRFPYLKEGADAQRIADLRAVLERRHYKNGSVTIDASDWYVDSRLRKKISEVGLKNTDLEQFKAFYLSHILDRANYYEHLSREMNGRHIPHTLLLHHNLTSALFLHDLIEKFKSKGWEVVDADQAYLDQIFNITPNVVPAGESLIWSMAKASGKYEKVLRYPAEDGDYEAPKMDALGL